jgi:DNA-binding transcriptional LysR family regulator
MAPTRRILHAHPGYLQMRENHESELDLNLLRVLDVLLRTGGVTRAAEELGMTQSGVSRALGRLRVHFDDALLLREGRRMVPTATAERLRGPVARILDDTRRQSRPDGVFDPAASTWSASISTSSYVEHWLVPALVDRLHARAPGMDLRVVGPLRGRADALEEGRIDLAIEPAGVLVGPNLMSRRLFEDGFACVLRRGHPAADRLDVDAYAALEHVLVAPNGRAGGPVDERLAAMGRSRRVSVQVSAFISPMPLIVDSDRIVTLPASIARDAARRWPVVLRPCPVDLGRFAIHAVWSARRRTDPAHRWLREQLVEATRERLAAEAAVS